MLRKNEWFFENRDKRVEELKDFLFTTLYHWMIVHFGSSISSFPDFFALTFFPVRKHLLVINKG